MKINIEDKIKKLAERKEIYSSLKEIEDAKHRTMMVRKAKQLEHDVYTDSFIEYLKTLEIGCELWSDGEKRAIVNTNHNSAYERIVSFVKIKNEIPSEHNYFGPDELKLLLNEDQDALKLYSDLNQRRFKLLKEIKQIERALKEPNALLLFKRFYDADAEPIYLEDGRTITREYFMGKPFIKVQ